MNIKKLFLLLFFFSNTTHSMKRELQNPSYPNNNKKQKSNTQSSSSLLTFFASNTQLKKAWTEIDRNAKRNQLPRNNYHPSKIVANTPIDIKKMIVQQSCFYNKEWWYTTNKKSYQANPYGVSLLNDNTVVVGLYDGTLEIIDLNTNERLLSFKTNKSLLSLTTNTKKDILACGFNDKSVELFKIHKTTTDYTLEPLREFATDSSVWSLAFTPTNDMIIGEKNGKITCLSSTGQELSSYKTEKRVYGLIAHSDEQSFTYGLSDGTLSVQNSQTNDLISVDYPIEKFDLLLALSFNNSQAKYAIGTDNGDIYFKNAKNERTFKCFNLPAPIYSLSFNEAGNCLAVGLNNETLHILKHYTSPTSDQIMLARAIKLWLQTKKPHKSIHSAESLLYIIAYEFKLDHKELTTIWETLPEEITNAIWLNARRMITFYGKERLSLETFYNKNNLSIIQLKPLSQKYEIDQKTAKSHDRIRKILHFWRISHPRTTKTVDSLETLITRVALIFNLRKNVLKNTLNTFPEKTLQELLTYYISP